MTRKQIIILLWKFHTFQRRKRDVMNWVVKYYGIIIRAWDRENNRRSSGFNYIGSVVRNNYVINYVVINYAIRRVNNKYKTAKVVNYWKPYITIGVQFNKITWIDIGKIDILQNGFRAHKKNSLDIISIKQEEKKQISRGIRLKKRYHQTRKRIRNWVHQKQ